MKTTIKKNLILFFIFLAMCLIMGLLMNLFLRTNKPGYVQITHIPFSNTSILRISPGSYFVRFGVTTDYLVSDTIYFASDKVLEIDNKSKSMKVFFPDGSCYVEFIGEYQIGVDSENWFRIDEHNLSPLGLKSMIRQQVIKIIKNTALLMNAKEAHINNDKFIRLCNEQLLFGLYESTFKVKYDTIRGKIHETKIYDLKRGDDGKAIVKELFVLKYFKIEFTHFNIKRLHHFDSRTVEIE
jgi:hypothetical protein